MSPGAEQPSLRPLVWISMEQVETVAKVRRLHLV